MKKDLKNLLFYIGVDKTIYDLVEENINNINRRMVAIFSGLGTALVGVMCILSMFIDSAAQNKIVYFCGFFGVLILFLLSSIYAKNHQWIVTPLVYVAFTIFLSYGIIIGTITNPSQQTVTFMVMLVLLPVIFIDKPYRVMIAIGIYVAIFIILCLKNKTGLVLSTDIMDAVIYGVLGFLSGMIVSCNKVRKFMLEHFLQDACRYDQLTRINNRNSFETDIKSYYGKCNEKLACVYVDVNGLHELNNTQGHLLGDIMLQYIAEQMISVFGKEYSYRIGGDEFVSFVIDKDKENIKYEISRLVELIEKQDYHVAVGYDCMDKIDLDVNLMLKNAETMMYMNKVEYYRDSSRDRRKK